jgi:hypothetical protein
MSEFLPLVNQKKSYVTYGHTKDFLKKIVQRCPKEFFGGLKSPYLLDISRFYLGPQNRYNRLCKVFLLSSSTCSQIWLIPLVHDLTKFTNRSMNRQYDSITKLELLKII